MMGEVYRDLKPENILVRKDGYTMLLISLFDVRFGTDACQICLC